MLDSGQIKLFDVVRVGWCERIRFDCWLDGLAGGHQMKIYANTTFVIYVHVGFVYQSLYLTNIAIPYDDLYDYANHAV